MTITDDYNFNTVSTFLDSIDSKDSSKLEAILYSSKPI